MSDDDFCLIHGRNFMRSYPGPIAYCARCEWPFTTAEEIVDQIREHTYRRGHDAGWDFDRDRDEAIDFVASALIEATKK